MLPLKLPLNVWCGFPTTKAVLQLSLLTLYGGATPSNLLPKNRTPHSLAVWAMDKSNYSVDYAMGQNSPSLLAVTIKTTT